MRAPRSGALSGAVHVRDAGPGDLEALLELYREFADERDGPPPQADAPGAGGHGRGALAEILAQPRRRLLVAELGARPVGTADVLVVANLTHACRPWAIVENVVVERQARRRGVGRALIERATELAREAGCYKLQLLSGKQRQVAHELYRSAGMEAVAEGFKLYL